MSLCLINCYEDVWESVGIASRPGRLTLGNHCGGGGVGTGAGLEALAKRKTPAPNGN
jgi:hypothetical protein